MTALRGLVRMGIAGAVAAMALTASAQQPQGPRPTARASAPLDLTGQWVSVITDDWRWRVVVPPVGTRK